MSGDSTSRDAGRAWRIAWIGLAAILAIAAPGLAAEPVKATPENERDVEPSADEDAEDATVAESSHPVPTKDTSPAGPPVYVPPRTGSGAPMFRVGAATRGADASLPMVYTLVPKEIGLTAEARPVLSWFLSQATSRPAEVAVVDPQTGEPIFTARVTGPLAAGVHRTRLADHGATLEPGVAYRWYVALVANDDDRTRDRVAGGGIMRGDVPADLNARLDAAGPSKRVHTLAAAGLWYDALDAASERIEAAPGDARARRDRGALLLQVGLDEPALADGAPR